MKKVTLSTHATEDYLSALDWYFKISPNLGRQFDTIIKNAQKNIKRHPQAWPAYRNRYRKINSEQFPFALIYQEMPDIIRIIAVADMRSEPGYWLNRV